MCALSKVPNRSIKSSPLWRHFQSVTAAISELLYPAVCVVCERRHASGVYSICPHCWRLALKQRLHDVFPESPGQTPGISDPMALDNTVSETTVSGTTKSRTTEPETTEDEDVSTRRIPAIALGKYQSPLSEMLQKFKYESFIALGERLAITLARLRKAQIAALEAEALVPVPLHISGFKARGFNQAEVISDILSRMTGLPVLRNSVEKIVKTKNQAKLTTEQRQNNLAGAFAADRWEFPQRKILIVDDVITTGATVAEVGRTLEQSGATIVGVIALASAVRQCDIEGAE